MSSAILSGEKYPTELGPVQIQRVTIDNHIKERSKFTLSIDFAPTKTVSQGTFDCAMSAGKFESDKSWNAGKDLVKQHKIIKGVKENKAAATLIVEGKVPSGLGPKSKVKIFNQFLLILASSGPYGPLLARSGYPGKGAFSLTKAFPIVGRNSILNFPAKI